MAKNDMKTTPKDEWKLTEPHYRDIHGSGFVEAICAHGVGHHRGIHGCDGCCSSWPDEIRDAVTVDTPVEGELSPDGKARVVTVDEKSWWMERPWLLAARICGVTKDSPLAMKICEEINPVLHSMFAEHRKMIVNEIREKIEKKKEPGHVTVAVAGFTRTNLVNNVLNHVLELPCLKDSRWRW